MNAWIKGNQYQKKALHFRVQTLFKKLGIDNFSITPNTFILFSLKHRIKYTPKTSLQN